MFRRIEDGARVAGFHHAAMPHDDDAVADGVGRGEVVGDEMCIRDRNKMVLSAGLIAGALAFVGCGMRCV